MPLVALSIFLRRKEKDGTEVIGNIIHCKNHKSRLTKENKMVDVRLTYDKGLDRHYGLLELALKHGIFKSVSTRVELPDGTKTFGKTINNNPEKYYTPEILEQLDAVCAKEFKYGDVIEEIDPKPHKTTSPKHREDYVFVEKPGEDFTALKLISGPFASIVYKYGNVGFRPESEAIDGALPMVFDYTIIENKLG